MISWPMYTQVNKIPLYALQIKNLKGLIQLFVINVVVHLYSYVLKMCFVYKWHTLVYANMFTRVAIHKCEEYKFYKIYQWRMKKQQEKW